MDSFEEGEQTLTRPDYRHHAESLYDERMASLRTEGVSSSYDHPELTHSDVDFTPSPRNEKCKKALSNSPSRSDGITVGASSTFNRLMMSMGT